MQKYFNSRLKKNYVFLLLIFGGFNLNTLSQTSSIISYEYSEIIEYSIKFSFSSNGTYQPYKPYISSQNILATLQARYDYNYDRVSTEWGKILNLKLVNSENKKLFMELQTTINTYVKTNSSNVDWSSYTTTESWLNFITQPYQVASIKNEIALLQSCKVELDRIKYKDPDNFLYSKRYRSIQKTLDLLKSCGINEIKNLSWEKTELEDNANDDYSGENNKAYFKVPNSRYFYRTNSRETVQIDKIVNSGDFTVIYLTGVPIKGAINGSWINFSSTAYIEQNGKKYYLKKAEGIPLSPNKYHFTSGDQSLTFKLYFDKSINLDLTFDLIEIEGSESAFNFFDISK